MRLQILVVESHGQTRRVLTEFLGHFGHSISAADTVRSATAFLKVKRFDAVLSDLDLPDGSGYDVVREAKRRQHIVAVAVTTGRQSKDAARDGDTSFDYQLTKPVDFTQLRSVLERITPAQDTVAA